MEGAFRIYLRGDDFKKHRLSGQDRTLRLQAYSERANRVRVNESFQCLVSSTARYHAEDMAAHDGTMDAVNTVSDNFKRHLQQSLTTTSSLEAHVTTVVGSYNDQMQTLIQSSHHSTVQQVNESMKQHILPIIQSFPDECRDGDEVSVHRNQRTRGQHSSPNMPQSDDYSKELSCMPHPVPQSVYRTPFGRLRVAYTRNDRRIGGSNGGDEQEGYWIRFDPHRRFSQNFVEWRLFFNRTLNGSSSTIWCDIEPFVRIGRF